MSDNLTLWTLEDIAGAIHTTWATTREHFVGLHEGYLRVGHLLAEARERFGDDDKGYGRWLAAQAFPFKSEWARRLRLLASRADDYRRLLASGLASSDPSVDGFLKSVGLLGTGSERRLPGPPPDLEGARGYGVIYADPPWPMPNWVESRDLERHYPTMSIEDIAALPVAGIAADDAVLYLWAISTHLHDALHVIEAWGFEYVAQMVWVKPSIGTGWWVRHQHELLLIGRRGEVSPPLPEQRPASVIVAPTGRHSEKPEAVVEMIETLWPGIPSVELFGRHRRHGWDVIGDEAA